MKTPLENTRFSKVFASKRDEVKTCMSAARIVAGAGTPTPESAAIEPGSAVGASQAKKEISDLKQAKGLPMIVEIIETPSRFHLHGIAGVVENERYGEVGLRLMNEMWHVVKGAGIPTTGINHWVYLPAERMFVGVELRDPKQAPAPDALEPLAFELPRHMKHVHVGPYQALPQKWRELKAELAVRGEIIGAPSLEMYGHPCDDPSKLETTILIGLQAKPT